MLDRRALLRIEFARVREIHENAIVAEAEPKSTAPLMLRGSAGISYWDLVLFHGSVSNWWRIAPVRWRKTGAFCRSPWKAQPIRAEPG